MGWFCCFGHATSSSKFNSNVMWRTSSGVQDSPQVPEDLRLFSYDEMRSATANFHPTNKIGKGGYGVVHKGTLRDGRRVAIKSLATESKQGNKEFLTEIHMVSHIRHCNLVQLIGCCVQGRNRILVYEYLENNSVASALLGPKSRRDFFMNWATRAAICVGTARGLVFLHEEAPVQFVHRDIKASNILLDKDLTPKIGDFGLAKLFPDSVSHISTRAVGTMGYLAPEYALLGQLTKKADVYSFGVLVLEMVSGKSSFLSMWDGDAPESLLEWAWRLRDDENRLLEMVDVELANDGYPSEEALRFIKVALVCTQAAAQQRPTMTQVLQLLLLSTHSEPSIMQANLPLLNVRNLSEPIALIRRSRNNVVSKNHALCKIQLSTASEDTSRSPRKRTAAYCTALNSTSVATSKQDNNNSYQMTKLQPRQINKDIASTYQMTDLHPR